MALIVGLPDAAESSPSRASLNGLDGINFFNAAMLAGFGPYVAVYLAEQKWTQENIGFVLTETSQHSSIEKIGSVKAVQPNQFTLRKYRC